MLETLLEFRTLAAFAAGYLFGAIPFGYIFTRAAGLGDIRETGSGNIGATNVLRSANKGLAALTLIFDLFKGTLGVFAGILVGEFMFPRTGVDASTVSILMPMAMGGLGALVGHMFPFWLRFKGGKGVATTIGVLLGFNWWLALIFGAIWLATAGVMRMSSLSAFTALAGTTIYAWSTEMPPIAAVISVMSLLVVWRHSDNIRRLIAGEEPKIGRTSTKNDPGNPETR